MLKKDKEVLKPAAEVLTDNNNKLIQDINQNKNFKLAKTLEDTYLTPLLTDKEDEDSPCTFYIKYPLNQAAAAYQSFPRDYNGERDPEV